MEGTLTGSFNELTMQNGIPLTADQQRARNRGGRQEPTCGLWWWGPGSPA